MLLNYAFYENIYMEGGKLKKRDLGLVIGVATVIFFLLFNIFVKNILNQYLLCILLILLLSLIYFRVGLEKNKLLNAKKILMVSLLITLSFLIIKYGIGLFTGFTSTPFLTKPLYVLKNTILIIVIISLIEIARYNIIVKSNRDKLLMVLFVILASLIDLTLAYSSFNDLSLRELINMLFMVLLPSIAKNIMLMSISNKYGYYPCLIYNLINYLYEFILPIIPNFNDFMNAAWNFITPIVILYLLRSLYEKKRLFVRKSKISNLITAISVIVIATLIVLNSNMFNYWIAVVATGSMTPTINVGDAIIVDKSVQKDLSKLKVGDVLVFKIKGLMYTHRIVSINESNGKYAISTQGDRVGNAIDSWTVTNDDVIGIVQYKIPYIGYPTVWLNRLTKEL
jgi:signal peptidase I